MDVAFILDKYFKGLTDVSIDVFDAQTLNAVYRDVINAMTSHFEIEVSALRGKHCFLRQRYTPVRWVELLSL